MKTLWNNADELSSLKTYKTYANAEKAAAKVVGDRNIRVVIAATREGRFFPVALGFDAVDSGLHFHMCVA